MGYDRAENETEDMTQQDSNMEQQSGQFGSGGQASQDDMQTAQSMVGQQGGYQDQDQGGGYQDQSQGGYDQNQQGGSRDQGMDSSQQGGYDQNQGMDSSQQGDYDQNQDSDQN